MGDEKEKVPDREPDSPPLQETVIETETVEQEVSTHPDGPDDPREPHVVDPEVVEERVTTTRTEKGDPNE